KVHEWFSAFEACTKTTMPQTKGFTIKGKHVIFREKRHCLHSNEVKKKQGGREIKRPYSARLQNINCDASIHLRLEKWRLELSHPLEINIRFVHNHVIDSAESLSFRHIRKEIRDKFLNLFNDGHSPASALHSHEDDLHLSAVNDQELLELLADRAKAVVNEYNSSGNGKAVLQKYNTYVGSAFILCIVTGLMCRVHEKVSQAGELCYMDASASFEPLNTSVTLLYTSCSVGALPLGLCITSDESEVTLEKALNLLKTILPPYAFYGRSPQIGPTIFLTDNSDAERNALELCWPQAVRLLCTFHFLQSFWRWLYNAKHGINKSDRILIMSKMKKILYALDISEINLHYSEFKQNFYSYYPLLRRPVEILWEHRNFWALSFRSGLLIRGNHMNNYIERSFGLLKDVVFARTQAYNPVQVFHFITSKMERFYEQRLLCFAHRRPGYLQLAKRFVCPGWESVDMDSIRKTSVENEFLVLSTKQNDLFYTVNSEIGTCTCQVGATGAPCKHQGAIAMKFHIKMLNFLPSLTPDDRMVYTYIALVAKNSSFYASLHANFTSQESESFNQRLEITSTMDSFEQNEEINNSAVEISDNSDNSTLDIFVEEVRNDYQNAGSQFCAALNKFIERYHAAISISITRLTSFLHNINSNVDATRIKSGAMIRVQVESVKRRKLEGSSRVRRSGTSVNRMKENVDSQTIPSRKKRKVNKKAHNLGENVAKNQLN
ncbi:28514_t:CDS:2, partial [Gigaspora margarita]